MTERIDYTTPEGAQLLAGKITHYWYERGHTVTCKIIPPLQGDRGWWTVRSDMVNGLPVKKEGEAT